MVSNALVGRNTINLMWVRLMGRQHGVILLFGNHVQTLSPFLPLSLSNTWRSGMFGSSGKESKQRDG